MKLARQGTMRDEPRLQDRERSRASVSRRSAESAGGGCRATPCDVLAGDDLEAIVLDSGRGQTGQGERRGRDADICALVL
jgi:hypothetical protein